MPLPVGTWKALLSGAETDFQVTLPNSQGQFNGMLLGETVTGFWDESAQRIIFTFNQATALIFEGYLFRTPVNPASGQDVVARLAGTFRTPIANSGRESLPLATARRNVFGWIAEITEVQ